MKIYQCNNCQHPVYFHNIICEKCKNWLGYLPDTDRIISLTPNQRVWASPTADARTVRYCANHQHDVCNWLVDASKADKLCEACDLNQTIPNLSDPDHLDEWRRLEAAKHKLVYALRRLQLPLTNRMSGKRVPLSFDFLSPDDSSKPVMTGHASGHITINSAEADPVHRETTRIEMNERYRTLIGHFRHEVGHYYWDVLIAEDQQTLTAFRELFGNDEEDYQEALLRHYKYGPPANWRDNYISEYATTHAWEDWAETWAHYLHLLDMVETANTFGISINSPLGPQYSMDMKADFDPYREPDMNRIIATCIPLTLAVNTLNLGMGRKRLYPFVINPPVRKKLAFVHDVVMSRRTAKA